MFGKSARLILAGAAAMLLAACGGGGGGGNNNPPANVAPTANAGPAQTVTAGATVTLNGAGSSDSDGTVAGFAWTQTMGTGVALSSASVAQPTFVAPAVVTATQLRFSLVVTDNVGASSAASIVTITVNPAPAANVTVTGTVRFQRVPLNATSPAGLKFASQVYVPARGVTVQALNATSLAVLATAATDDTGLYSLSVASNTNIIIRVTARMLRDASQTLPRWDVRVQNGVGGLAYTYSSAAFNSSLAAQNVDIPSGIDTSGNPLAGSTRASGPFAVLDTIYTSMQAIAAVDSSVTFPALYVDWGDQDTGTFFTTANGQHIALMGDLTEDTDEFDQHVVAHEFGHYIEYNFSRSDSIGGPHGLGDRLDMRVAFGEGFGYAFAAIVLNDPVVLDSFFNGQHVAGGFHIESNPPIDSGATTPVDGPGCWCSESTVWSFLWDLHDPAAGAGTDNDGIALGFAPIWQVMTGAQRTTPALTSIFSFVTALKLAQPAVAAQIDARMALNNIVANMDPFAATETNTPFANILPMYTTLTPGNPQIVFSTGTAGPPDRRYNKAGNRRFLRFTPAANGSVTVSLTTSNPNPSPDPDFLVFRSGTLVAVGIDPPAAVEFETFAVLAGETYIIDAYDCANGCDPDPPQGVAGDYDLTVTIN